MNDQPRKSVGSRLVRAPVITFLVAAAIVLAIIGAFTGHHSVGHWLAVAIICLGVAGLATLLDW